MRLPLDSIYPWCRENGIEISCVEATGAWLYKDGKLLRSFIVNHNAINTRDFRNWCLHMGYVPVE